MINRPCSEIFSPDPAELGPSGDVFVATTDCDVTNFVGSPQTLAGSEMPEPGVSYAARITVPGGDKHDQYLRS